MHRLRSSLFLLALAALFLSGGAPTQAGEPEAGAPAVPAVAGDACAPAALPADRGLQPAGEALAIPPDDFILCSCKLCREYPDIDCQISPTGFSILCEDYYRWRCV